MWTSRTLDSPDLASALRTAASAPPSHAAVLTHRHLAREHPLVATPDLRVVTTHVPGDEPPPAPARSPYHLHISPHPTPRALAEVVRFLLQPGPAAARRS